ncbi:MAG: GNAT family N-acetyltransferase [Desulfobacter sp.]|nr:MAG: GNAT family N-acetyltransferase [Desulfobacter sp.]
MKDLYKDAGWWEPAFEDDYGFLERLPISSALFAGAFAGNQMVGMGRALSDLCSDAFIQDVVVLKAYRNKGIAREIVLFLAQELKKRGVDWIGLVAEPGTASFYEKMGFSPLEGHIPMRLKV